MPADFFVFVLYYSRLFVSLQQKTNSLNIYEATTNWELGTWNASSLWRLGKVCPQWQPGNTRVAPLHERERRAIRVWRNAPPHPSQPRSQVRGDYQSPLLQAAG